MTTPLPDGAVDLAVSMAYQRENARLRGDLRTIGRRLAHDLRTPLNCINISSEALRDAPDLESVQQLTRSICASTEEATRTIDRMSMVLLATATGATREPLIMGEVVWDALQRLESRIQESGASTISPPAWPAADGVAAWVDLIWTNLVANSLQHAGEGVRIQVGTESIGSEQLYWVRDNGPGVPLEKRASLFHPLERLSELNAPRTYGLSIVHRLVQLHEGRCGYDPSPAPGGTFFFTLGPA